MDRHIADLPKFAPQLRGTIMLPGCGHITQEERATEVNAAMIDFLGACLERQLPAAVGYMTSTRDGQKHRHGEGLDNCNMRANIGIRFDMAPIRTGTVVKGSTC
jgi:hypothetical protein